MKRNAAAVTITDEGVLVCPECGGNNLHHKWIRDYFRKCGEDKATIVTEINGRGVRDLSSFDGDSNPSERSSGIRISFWCETCLSHVELVLAQHKGQTFLNMESIPDAYNFAETIEYVKRSRNI